MKDKSEPDSSIFIAWTIKIPQWTTSISWAIISDKWNNQADVNALTTVYMFNFISFLFFFSGKK